MSIIDDEFDFRAFVAMYAHIFLVSRLAVEEANE